MHVLVTGGAGFVGSFLCEELHRSGVKVRVFDNYEPQVHFRRQSNLAGLINRDGSPRDGLHVVRGDVRNRAQLAEALQDIDAVVHLAAQVGVGQSMYEIQRYADHNVLGTAVLLDLLASAKHRVRKLVVASSMSIYGEGAASCSNCGDVTPNVRTSQQVAAGGWQVPCPRCGQATNPRATTESKPLQPASVYAITKRDQEEMCLVVGRAYDLPTVALRFFNIYGPRQSLANPYTGVAAIFSSRIMNNNAPFLFEDGNQTRDFVHVNDIVQALMLALTKDEANGKALNVGTGRATSIKELAHLLSRRMGKSIPSRMEHKFREGDVRHCFADITEIQSRLGYKPMVNLEDGLKDLVMWAKGQEAEDHFEMAAAELKERGLAR